MSPSEYQELTEYFVDQLGRHHKETRAFVEETFDSVRQEMASLRTELRSYVGVSVESLRHEIRLVADGVLTNGRRIEENGRRIDENTRRIEENTVRIEANTLRIEANGQRIEANGQRIEANGQRIEENGRRIEANGQRIDALTDRVGNLEIAVSSRFSDHDERLSALESP